MTAGVATSMMHDKLLRTATRRYGAGQVRLDERKLLVGGFAADVWINSAGTHVALGRGITRYAALRDALSVLHKLEET